MDGCVCVCVCVLACVCVCMRGGGVSYRETLAHMDHLQTSRLFFFFLLKCRNRLPHRKNTDIPRKYPMTEFHITRPADTTLLVP
ncbi:unnamed protein product [Gadus morhua 'NCC']